MFGYLLPLVSPEWQLCLKLKDNLTLLDLLKLRPTDEAFLLTYLQIKGEESLMPEAVQGSLRKRGRKRGYASLSDNTNIFITQLEEVVQRRKACLRVDDQTDLKGWYEAALAHAKEGTKTIVDVPAEEEEDANVPQAPNGANQSGDRRGGRSLADVMLDLGVNGEWMGI
jgi:hypothetical protein